MKKRELEHERCIIWMLRSAVDFAIQSGFD
jgi:hypothetical protein